MGPNVNLGQVLIATLYAALANGPKWNNTLFMITYDESGGFFDHVVPGTLADERAEFRQLGFRVPGLVIGPHVRVGCANNNIFDHASVIATATQRFGLDPLNERVAATNDLSSCIHPDLLTDPQPGIVLPEIEIDEGGLIEKLEHVNTQPELWAAAENGEIPTELDYRSDLVGTTRALIRKARDYGLVRDAFKWG
jgi:phospholipase C